MRIHLAYPLILVATACATASGPAAAPNAQCPASAPAPAPVASSAPTPLPVLDEAQVKDRSHAFYDALDRADAEAFKSLAGPAFVVFGHGRFHVSKQVAELLQARLDEHAPARTRDWKSERIFLSPGVAVFVGETIEKVPAEESHPAGQTDTWQTLVWTFDGTSWLVSHWQSQGAGVEAEREAWNDAYRGGVNFNHNPNQLLIDTIKGRKPGTALDVAMGQGRNALYLASQGWRVTGVDISDEGIKQAKAAADERKLKLDAVQADDTIWDFGTNKWDLVTLIYAGSKPEKVEKIRKSVKKGGLVVVEFFQKEATAGTGVGGFAQGELAAAFHEGWKILRDEAVEDTSDWGLRKTKLVRFVAEKQ
jgi:SAM-dependent methyltransferase